MRCNYVFKWWIYLQQLLSYAFQHKFWHFFQFPVTFSANFTLYLGLHSHLKIPYWRPVFLGIFHIPENFGGFAYYERRSIFWNWMEHHLKHHPWHNHLHYFLTLSALLLLLFYYLSPHHHVIKSRFDCWLLSSSCLLQTLVRNWGWESLNWPT